MQRYNSIPVIYSKGTYYEVGFDVGRTFRGLIESHLERNQFLKDELLPAYETPSGKSGYESCLSTLKNRYPHYVRELQGTADGAKVPFHKLFLLHLDTLMPKFAHNPPASSMGCSSICCNYGSQVVLGHTEDALPDTLNHLYIVSAHITEEDPQGILKTKEEGFTALCYAGMLPGYCMGYNHHGLVYSINVIFPEKVYPGKTPRHFLCRAMLSADTMKGVENILRDEGAGCADGMSVNLILSKQEGDHVFHNIEVGPVGEAKESQLSVLTMSNGEHSIHANRYLRLDVAEDDLEYMSSKCRLQRSCEMAVPDSREAVLNILSDTTNQEYPFFRQGNDPDPVVTTTVGLFDIIERTWTFWMKNPSESEPLMSLPLVFKWED